MLTNTPECHFAVEVRGAFDGVEEISAVPMLFTPAHDKHPLAPIAGPIVVRGAKPSDVVMIESWPPIGVCVSAAMKGAPLLDHPTRFSGGSLLLRDTFLCRNTCLGPSTRSDRGLFNNGNARA